MPPQRCFTFLLTTTLDVLNRAPGITQDAADNLDLRDRPGVLFVIEGKGVPLTSTALAYHLKRLPAEQA